MQSKERVRVPLGVILAGKCRRRADLTAAASSPPRTLGSLFSRGWNFLVRSRTAANPCGGFRARLAVELEG